MTMISRDWRHIANKLKHQIAFMENISISENEPEIWQEKLITFAEIIPISDVRFELLENFNFGHVMTQGFFLIRMRFIRDLTIRMRILFKDRSFEIKRIININEQNKFLQLIVLEI